MTHPDQEHRGTVQLDPKPADSTLRAWPAFATRVRSRLEAGAREYPESPDRSELELLDEVQQELEDVCGWSCVLWSKLEALKAKLGPLADGYPPSRAVVAPDAASGKLSPPRATPGAPGTEGASQGPSRASNRHRPNPASLGAITPELTPEAARANQAWEQLPRRARAAALGSEASTSQGVEP